MTNESSPRRHVYRRLPPTVNVLHLNIPSATFWQGTTTADRYFSAWRTCRWFPSRAFLMAPHQITYYYRAVRQSVLPHSRSRTTTVNVKLCRANSDDAAGRATTGGRADRFVTRDHRPQRRPNTKSTAQVSHQSADFIFRARYE